MHGKEIVIVDNLTKNFKFFENDEILDKIDFPEMSYQASFSFWFKVDYLEERFTIYFIKENITYNLEVWDKNSKQIYNGSNIIELCKMVDSSLNLTAIFDFVASDK